jgi:hypothetical protein
MWKLSYANKTVREEILFKYKIIIFMGFIWIIFLYAYFKLPDDSFFIFFFFFFTITRQALYV